MYMSRGERDIVLSASKPKADKAFSSSLLGVQRSFLKGADMFSYSQAFNIINRTYGRDGQLYTLDTFFRTLGYSFKNLFVFLHISG